MIGIDTNVLARHLVGDDPKQAALAARFIGGLTSKRRGFVTHIALAELDWVLKTSYGFSREARLAALNRLVELRDLEFEDGESVVRALALAEDGADFADALIAASGELFGVTETVTFDRAAAKRLGWRALAS
ncbi:MAG: type II toxin-antitoxin system VapC family toxin [Protaetiibacter sp.]